MGLCRADRDRDEDMGDGGADARGGEASETDAGDTRWTMDIKASEVLGAGELSGGDRPRGLRNTRPQAAVEAQLQLVAL